MEPSHKKSKSNVSKLERDAIILLRKNNDIVIFEADTGVHGTRKHLNSVDTYGNRTYEELSFDCTQCEQNH